MAKHRYWELYNCAAALLWEDRKRDEDIAAELGISRRSLARWKKRPELREDLRARIDQRISEARSTYYSRHPWKADKLRRYYERKHLSR